MDVTGCRTKKHSGVSAAHTQQKPLFPCGFHQRLKFVANDHEEHGHILTLPTVLYSNSLPVLNSNCIFLYSNCMFGNFKFIFENFGKLLSPKSLISYSKCWGSTVSG